MFRVDPRQLGAAAALAACLLLGTFTGVATAAPTCPPPNTVTINPGDPPLSFQGACNGAGAVTYAITTSPSHGSLSFTGPGASTYTPTPGFSGTDSFAYTASDSTGTTAPITITINVVGGPPPPPVGQPPSCPNPVHVFVPSDGFVDLVGNCADPEGGPINYSIVPGTGPANGSLTITGAATARYTPFAGTTTDSFQYSATDNDNNRVTAQVLITVTSPTETQFATAPSATATEPLVVGIQTAQPASVFLGPRPTSVPNPTGFVLLGTEFNIVAPDQPAPGPPLRLTFTVDQSKVPTDGTVVPFRNGAAIDQPCAPGGQASPDPCIVSNGSIAGGDVEIVVLSTHASRWNLGYRPDTVKPIVTYSGNAGTYTLDQTVAITCSASDPEPGSGIASTTCADVNAPAYTLGVGPHTLSATATDRASNTGTGETSFTVRATPTGLCRVTNRLVQASAKYQALPARLRTAVDARVTAACAALDPVVASLSPARKALLIGAYKAAVQALAGAGWLTADEATTLSALAGGL